MLSLLCLLTAAEAVNAFDATDKNRPVTKVINLLKDMGEQLEKEADEDESVYEKVSCWCQTNDKGKTASIADAEARITSLTASIEEGTASSSRLNTEIKNLNHEISKNEDALDKATSIREHELAEFNGEEKDLLQSIGALKSAVTVLGKHNALVQVPEEMLLSVAATIEDQLRRHADLVKQLVTPSQRKAMTAFVQQPAGFQSYAPQSGAIFGILKQMKETFETNLGSSQKEEMQNQEAYEELKAAKLKEIKAGEDQRDTKTQELADTDSKVAQDKQDLDDTRNSLSADQEFLLNLKETCQNTDQEWEERQKARAEEVQAVSEALSILSSDDAHDTFTKTFNFVQVGQKKTTKRDTAVSILLGAAKKSGSPKLVALAMSAKLAGFTKLIADVDGMISDLKQEKQDDIKQKDFCNEKLNSNDQAQVLKARDIERLDAKIADLTARINELAQAIAQLEAEIAEMQVQLKRAGEDRELENADFQKTVADQRATQKLLNQALGVLKGVYAKKGAFIQKGSDPAGPPPPPGFKTYKKAGGAGGVLGMLEQIISDAKQLEADAIKSETDGQKAYESFVKETNKSLDQKTRDITNKSDEKAQAEVDKTAAEESREAASNEQQQNKNEEADLHKVCDFTLQNFDVKQAALDQEMESLAQVKSVLSGSSFGFMQKRF